MYYLADHHHTRDGGEPFREKVDSAFERMDGGTVVFEHLVFHPKQAENLSKLYNGVLTGETDVEETEEGLVLSREGVNVEQTLDGSRATVVEGMLENPDAVDEVDVGPVHGSRVRNTWELLTDQLERFDASEGASDDLAERLHRTTSRYMNLVDEEYADHVDERVESGALDPDNTLVVMGAAHNLDRRLARTHDVERLNADLPPTNEFSAAGKLIDRRRNGLDDPVPRAEFAHPFTVARDDDRLPVDELDEVRAANREAGGERPALVDELLTTAEDLTDEDVGRTAEADASRLAERAEWVPDEEMER